MLSFSRARPLKREMYMMRLSALFPRIVVKMSFSSSALGPMRDLVAAKVLQDDLLAEVEHVITVMEDAIRDGSGTSA
jgi:hypothetical protein